jgi:UDP-glucose 4-epimerase
MVKVLVIGGAGYIGSHTVKLLKSKGIEVAVFDNLEKGHKEAVLTDKFYLGDTANKEDLLKAFKDFNPDAVIHFAAFIEVGESVKNPLKYYKNNFANSLNLFDVMVKCNVKYIVFSSTAAVYGMPNAKLIDESLAGNPINPYGESKYMTELALDSLSKTEKLSYVALRYFNASGASPDCEIGEAHNPETHLIPLVLQTASKKRDKISIFGNSYPTKDGTCIRDYIHVDDLAEAHFMALSYLLQGGKSDAFNCGYGQGYSVLEIIETVKKVTKKDFKVEVTAKREGDPPYLVASNEKIKKTLGWTPKFNNIEYIIETAWNWEQNRKF